LKFVLEALVAAVCCVDTRPARNPQQQWWLDNPIGSINDEELSMYRHHRRKGNGEIYRGLCRNMIFPVM
jgi:hypothetical protein